MRPRNNQLTIILLGVVILMGVEIIYLIYQNRQLQSSLDDPARLMKETLQRDQMVPPIRAEDINGNEISVPYGADQPHSLLFWFSPGCSSCEGNFDFWNQIQQCHKPEVLRLLGLCACTPIEGKTTAAEQSIMYPVIAVTAPAIVDMYKGNLLPQTILISPEGKITRVWPGALLESQKKEILSLLGALNAVSPEGGEVK